MATENGFDLEDLARRYDAQVLREFLLEERRDGAVVDPSPETPLPVLPEVFDLRPRCFRLIRFMLVLNFFVYWTVVVYCGYSFYLRVVEVGTPALPPLESSLLGFFTLGTQSTLELAAVLCLTQPAPGSTEPRGGGLRAWDGVAWVSGFGARASLLLDLQCLPLMWRGSSLLFLLSASVYAFAVGIFVFGVQFRLLAGLFCASDLFSYDKPDLFFKGRDVHAAAEGTRIAARPPEDSEDEVAGGQTLELELARVDRPPPHGAVKVANMAHLSDLTLLHAALVRLFIPVGYQESQEFTSSVTSFSRCFCEDVVQCNLKFFFLLAIEVNAFVLLSLLVSAAQATAVCIYSTTAGMDIRSDDEVFSV